MAFDARLKSKFFSRDGSAYQIWIEDESGSGVVEVKGQASPIVLDAGRRGIDPFVPIIGSKAELALWNKAGSEFDDLLDADTQEFRVRLVSGTSHAAIDADTYDTKWLGYLILDNFDEDTVVLPAELSLEANDGLAELKNVPYTDDSGMTEVAYTGVESYRVIAKRCLDKLGYSLPFRMASRLFPDSVAKTVDPWDNMEADNRVFYSDEGEAASCYEVLQQLLYRMSSQLYQVDGSWQFIAYELQDGSSYTVYLYDAGGSADGTDTQGTAIDIDALIAAGTATRDSGRRGFIQPIGSAALQYNHGILPSLIRGGTFESQFFRGGRGTVESGDDYTDYWTFSSGVGVGDPEVRDANGQSYQRDNYGPRGFGRSAGSSTYYTGNGVLFIPADFHGTSRDPDTVKSYVVGNTPYADGLDQAVTTGQKIVFKGTVKIPGEESGWSYFSRNLFQAYWRLEIDGADYILAGDGTWEASGAYSEAQKTQHIVPPGDEWGDSGLQLNGEYSFEFISEAAPADGDILLRLYSTTDVDGADLAPEGVEWDNIEVIVVDEDGEILESTLTEVWTGLPDKPRPAIQMVIGPGPVEYSPGAVTWGGTYYTDFETDLITTAKNLDLLTAETWLRFLDRFLERRYETYTGVAAKFGVPLTINSRNFALTNLRWDVRHSRVTFECVRHVYDSSSTLSSDQAARATSTFSLNTGTTQPVTAGVTNLSEIAGYISTQNPIALTDAEYEDGDMLSVLTVDGLTDAGLLDGDIVVVVDRVTARPFVFQISADEADVTWDVEDPNNPGNPLTIGGPIASGSGIYFSNAQLLDLVRNGGSPITTKGDIIVGDASGDDERLAVGADYRFPWARAGATLGVEWSDYSAPTSVFTGSFLNAAGDTVNVENGWITSVESSLAAVAYIYYLTGGGTDGTIRRMTPDGTDSEVNGSLETLTGGDFDQNEALAFIPETQQLAFASDSTNAFSNAQIFVCDLDAGNPAELEQLATVAEIGRISAMNYRSGALLYGSLTESIGITHLGMMVNIPLCNIGGDDILAIDWDPEAGEVYEVHDSGTDGLNNVADDGSDYPGTKAQLIGSKNYDCFAFDPDIANVGEATTGRFWLWEDNDEEIELYDKAGTLLEAWDMGTEYSGIVIKSMAYDAINDQLYFYRSDDDSIWVMPAAEGTDPSDATKIGDAGTAATSNIVIVHEGGYTLPDVADIEGLALWLDAADALDSGGAGCADAENVATWPDQSGNGRDATQTSDSLRPVFDEDQADFNNLPGVEFDGTEYMQFSDGDLFRSDDAHITAFFVIRAASGSNGMLIYCGEYGSSGVGLKDNGADLDFYIGGLAYDGIGFTRETGQLIIGETRPDIGQYFSYTPSGSQTTAPLGTWTAANADSPQLLGTRANTFPTVANTWEGQIAEIMLYETDEPLTYAQKLAIQNYLNTKYGL